MAFDGTYTPVALYTELTTDPKTLGYATPLALRNIAGNTTVVGLINSLTGNGAATIELETMTASEIATIMLPYFGAALTSAPSLTAVHYAYYTLMFAIVMAQQGPIAVGNLSAFGAQMVSDGIITAAEAAPLGQRIGSRAEVLWGQGTVVAEQDIEQVMGETF
jgi:hypothetical protein